MRTDGLSAPASVLVTGGTGFVGAHIARAAARRGHRVTVLSRSEPDADTSELWQGLDIKVTIGDVRSLEAVVSVARDSAPKVVVHAAAISTEPAPFTVDALSLVDTNVCGSICVLLAGVACEASRVVLVSSASVYNPPGSDSAVLAENAPLRQSGWYAMSKIVEESVGREFAAAGLDVVIARVAAAYGPLERSTKIRLHTSVVYEMIQQLRSGHEVVVNEPDRVLDFTYVGDIAEAICYLGFASELHHLEYNVACGYGTTLAEVLSSGQRRFKLDGSLSDRARVDITSPADGRRGRLAITRLLTDTAFRPQYSFDQGINEYCDWVERDVLR